MSTRRNNQWKGVQEQRAAGAEPTSHSEAWERARSSLPKTKHEPTTRRWASGRRRGDEGGGRPVEKELRSVHEATAVEVRLKKEGASGHATHLTTANSANPFFVLSSRFLSSLHSFIGDSVSSASSFIAAGAESALATTRARPSSSLSSFVSSSPRPANGLLSRYVGSSSTPPRLPLDPQAAPVAGTRQLQIDSTPTVDRMERRCATLSRCRSSRCTKRVLFSCR